MSITAADILAAIDVLEQAQEESDDIDFELAVNLRKACQILGKQSKKTADLLEMEMLRQVEAGSKEFGGIQYVAANDNKTTWDHDSIESWVVGAARTKAINTETGEIEADEAARQAAHWMRRVYVSASTTAKIGALGELGLDGEAVREREKKGRKLLEIDTQG